MKKCLIFQIVCLWILTPFSSFTQQVNYVSQAEGLLGVWFPSHAALGEAPSLAAYNRTRWVGFKDAPSTSGILFELPFKTWNTGLSINAELELNGSLQFGKIAAGYSYKVIDDKSSGNFLSLGLAGGAYQFSIASQRLTTGTNLADPLLINSPDPFVNLFFNLGFNWEINPRGDDKLSIAFAWYKPVENPNQEVSWIEEKEALFAWFNYSFNTLDKIYFGPRASLNYFNSQFFRSDISFFIGFKDKVELNIGTFQFQELTFSCRLLKNLIPNLPLELQLQYGSSLFLQSYGLGNTSTFEFVGVFHFE